MKPIFVAWQPWSVIAKLTTHSRDINKASLRMTKIQSLDNQPPTPDSDQQVKGTVAKQAKITRFLPARKARENSKQSTPIGKRTRAGLVAVGEPDVPSSSTVKNISDTEKSPECKRTRQVVESPSKQKKSVVDSLKVTNQKEDTVKAVPAYQRFAHLLDAADNDAIDRLHRPHLPLPAKYQLLVRLQQALDSAVAIQSGRGQRPVWHRLIPALQATLNRTVKWEHVELLRHFLPGVYVVEACKVVEKGRRVDSHYIDLAVGQESMERVRKDALLTALFRHVEGEHLKYLQSINVVLPKNVELRNWHPKFDLENVVDPEIRPASETVLEEKVGDSVPDIIKQAIEAVRPHDKAASDENTTKPDKDKPSDREVKKPLSLKERIRLKEQQAQVDKMTGPNNNISKQLYASLPDLIERLSFLFSSSKKSVLFLSHVHERLKQSMGCPWSESELNERLDVLGKHLDDWIIINRTDAPFTVKLAKTCSSVKELRERIIAAAPK